MSLPVSQYEALLAEVRGLREKAQRVQQLARPLLDGADYPCTSYSTGNVQQNVENRVPLDYTMESLLLDRQHNAGSSGNYERAEGETTCSEEEYGVHGSSTHMSVSSEPVPQRNRGMSSLYHGTWPVEKTMWNSEPTSLGGPQIIQNTHLDVTSVMSFASSSGGVPLDRVLGSPDRSRRSSQQLEAKVDMVYSLLAMLGGQEHADMGQTLLALSTSPESCLAMRQSGCIPLLVQLVQSDRDKDTRKKASQALHNLVHSQPDEKIRKRETRILKLLEHSRAYTEALRANLEFELETSSNSEDGDKHPVQTVAHIMKLSFDEGHRQAICQLGGIHTIASLVEAEHIMHGSTTNETHCIVMRRYACMALTNLTFGDSGNKALLCSFREFMRALVVQLQSPSDELRQVTASVLRNLSWRADSTSKDILREVGSVTGLMKSAMVDNKENTLKSILSALWNLSAHCTENKSEICAVEGALGFLVDMLTYKTPSKSLAIIENSGGILRNISSQIAVRDDYREILRVHNCLQILLDQLKSPSLTIVSNACGTLWNLSAKCSTDQETLWQMGAPSMLRSLNHSKHKMIAMGSSAALKNLLSARPQQTVLPQLDSTALSLDLPVLPTLGARKQKALLQDLDNSLSETYENIEKESPVKAHKNDKYTPTNDFVQKPKFIIEDDSLNNAFASLNINEPSTSYSNDLRVKHKTYGNSSLPYLKAPVKRTTPCTYIPVRNKVTDCAYEDEIGASDQPVDYSQKYSETKLPNHDANSSAAPAPETSSNKDSNNYSKVENESFSIYAETDLDQPTDYSLRYAENDSDSDICTKNPEYVQDTVKTYCTEDTPYETTPFNFSTATSMSDLRVDQEKPVIDNDKLPDSVPKTKEANKSDEKDHCSTEDISDIDNRPKVSTDKVKSEFSSGMMSPEKPVNYCEEGTPGYFSRVSSFGSLNSIPVNETIKKDSANLSVEGNKTIETKEKTQAQKSPAGEGKAVKFEQQVNYAEETPLMFSRSSSLASLDSIEQHSIHDDRSSIVSDLSRLTSGIVSPSELPDSPTQTVPPSPKPRKMAMEFPSTSKGRQNFRPQLVPRTVQKPSVFEDNLTKFKEESTPIQFSTATSLSSLTIDDQDDNEPQNGQINNKNVSLEKEEQGEKKDAEKEATVADDLAQESEDEGDEDILAACINIGMQNNRYNQNKTNSQAPLSNFKYQSKLPTSSSNIPLPRSSIPPSRSSSRTVNVPPPINDTVKTYCTEDTPAVLSNAGSNSDLSALSIPADNKNKRDYLSDDSSNLSGDNDDILAACIQAGMPKSKGENKLSTTSGSNSSVISGSSKAISSCMLPRRNIASNTSEKFNNKTKRDYLSDESSNLSGDNDDILAECIQAGMPKPRRGTTNDNTTSMLPRRNISSSTPVKFNSVSNDNKNKRDYLSDESSNLSGDNDDILAECIQAGMPKPDRGNKLGTTSGNSMLPRRSAPIKCNPGLCEANKIQNTDINRKGDMSTLPVYFSAGDELESYAVENSPCHYSLRSSLSDLTVEGSVAGLKRSNQTASSSKNNGRYQSSSQQSPNLNISNESNACHKELSRRESLSSISIESLGSFEAEQALLEQCISSGMPRNNMSITPSKPLDIVNTTKPVGIATKQFARKSQSRSSTQDVEEADKKPKNVNVASVAGNTVVLASEVCPAMSPAAAGVEKSPEQENDLKQQSQLHHNPQEITGTQTDMLQDKCLHSEENLLTGLTKSGSNKSLSKIFDNTFDNISPEFSYSNSDNCVNIELKDDIEGCLARSCELSAKMVDNRMLDPDAMIESLDRFTAELVSQASHLNKEENYKISTSENTWNDDTSPNEITFPSISGSVPNVITFKSDKEDEEEASSKLEPDVVDGLGEPEQPQSNDFSSCTMTASTLIAIEASKMIDALKNDAEMSQSITSAASLELDHVQPPSQLNSLTNSVNGLPKSPKLIMRKKSLPVGLLVKRALNNSLNHGSSVESLTNLDHMNPPSDMYDMEGSMTSLASLPSENAEVKPDFIINGAVNKQQTNPMFKVKHFANSNLNSVASELENINPPSYFNEITDMCNSLADIQTETIGSETENFEDCFTHIAETTVNDPTEFSDANSITPIPSDIGSSSAESTPKKNKNSLSKSMTAKHRRNVAKERYKTYTIGAEMLSREESTTEDFHTVCGSTDEDTTYVSPTYSITSSKLTPKDRRKLDKARFETRVVDEAVTNVLEQPIVETPNCDSGGSSKQSSPVRTKLSIRRSFLQKRLENKDRFKTQVLSESSFSPEPSSASPPLSANGETDLHLLVQKDADLVVKTLRESNIDELLDCETLSLVSNDDDSEHNSGGSINYRTYHKSWGIRRNNIPIVQTKEQPQDLVNCPPSNLACDQKPEDSTEQSEEEECEENKQSLTVGKPKIVKPDKSVIQIEDSVNEEQTKGIRGRRKPLYSRTATNKPIRNVTSNLVKNVTSALKSGTPLKSVASKQNKNVVATRPPMPRQVVSSGYGSRPSSASSKASPARPPTKFSPKPPLERQGTFTKDDLTPTTPQSKIPTTTKIPTFTSKIARASPSNSKNVTKSASADRSNRNARINFNRSTSADSRETRKIQSSSSSQSLKSDSGRSQNGAVKKSGIPGPGQRSNSNSSINSNGTNAKKQVTSKIANIWKKIEESKKQVPKKDTRVWIQAEPEPEIPRLIRSNTFGNKDDVVMRNNPQNDGNTPKRVSRLGSFIVMDENPDNITLQQAIAAATGNV